MAEKGFGVKEVNLIGASGTPTITSPNNLNLNANNVAISTNVSIGGTLSVTGNVSVGGTLTYEDVTNIDSVGVVTARSGLSVTGGTSFFAGAISAAGGITGTATTATNITVTANNTANETVYPLFSDGASGSQGAETDTGLTYNPSTNLFTAGSFSGGGANLTSLPAGQLTGTVADARISTLTASKLSGALPAISGANLTNLNGSNIASGTVADARISTLTASKLSGALPAISGASLTNIPEPDEAPVVDFTVTANGSSAYRFSGGGIDSSADDPTLYLIRGQKYRFNNTTGSAHPFQFRLTTSGSAYTAGITGDQNGVQFFTPEQDAPSKLYYVCTLHSNMVGTIYLQGSNGPNENVGVTTFGGTSHISLPSGTTGQRPTGAAGMMRYNSTLSKMEFHNGTDWVQFKDNFFTATGGSTSTFGVYTLHTFTSNGTFAVTGGGTIDILVVAGGGQGGLPNASDNYGGGGGAGGLVWYTSFEVSAGNYSIVVGDGGAQTSSGSGNRRGNDGSNSTAFGLTALGGGGGGGQGGTTAGRNGGSGGGGGYPSGFGSATQPSQSNSLGSGSLIHNLGNNGAPGNNSPNGGGGGGGAGGTGFSGGASVNGGAGFNASSLVGTSVGDSGWFAGGGGGSQQAGYSNFAGSNGGNGGGGDGDNYNSGNQTAGQANTGGGGGAGTSQGGGKGGGSGVVIVRYTT